MLRLPELRHDRKTWRLPLTGRGAVQLANALLGEDARERQSRFDLLLLEQPALVLWSLCRREAFRLAPPRNGQAISGWLARQPLTIWSDMTEDGSPDGGNGSPSHEALWYRLTQGFSGRWAHLTADVIRCDPSDWVRLLIDPVAWLASSGDIVAFEDVRAGDSCLPMWLAQSIGATSGDDDRLRLSSAGATQAAVSRVEPAAPDDAPRGFDLLALIDRLAKAERVWAELQDEKLAAMRELAYGASHEINNPLANIATRAQSLLSGESDPERRRTLAVIAAQAFRAHEMISDLMLFAKPPALRRGPVRLTELLTQVASELHEAAIAQGTMITVSATPVDHSGEATIDADFGQVVVAIKAIVQNALEAIGQGGRVELSHRLIPAQDDADELAEFSAKVAVVIRDDGPGISPEVQKHLFDPFYSGREAGRGLGFGLAKAWRIVTDHGGQISVVSQPSEGAEFTLTLPADASCARDQRATATARDPDGEIV